jgi:isocitrate dehydrogenase (NAD+)
VRTITLIAGDGIGPEVTRAAADVVRASGAAVAFEEVPAGGAAESEVGTPLPRAVFDSIERTRVALKGPTRTPFGGDYGIVVERAGGSRSYPSIAIALRRELGLFVNVRPIRNYPGVAARFALDYMQRFGRRRLTIGHKANVMKMTDAIVGRLKA